MGEWKNGFFDGHGTFYAHLGWKYVGGWKKGTYHGSGTKTTHIGTSKGVWKNGGEWNVTEKSKYGDRKWVNGKRVK